MKKKKKESPMRKMIFVVFNEKDGEMPGSPAHHGIRCPGCKERMEDFNINTNVFECKCGLNWKLTFTPVGRKLVKKTMIKRRKK